jgi:hypothetical protein
MPGMAGRQAGISLLPSGDHLEHKENVLQKIHESGGKFNRARFSPAISGREGTDSFIKQLEMKYYL